MDVGRYLVEAHLREGRPISELARSHGVHRSWLYKLLRRYRREGEAGLVPRSRRPHRSPAAIPLAGAAEIVPVRTTPPGGGLDAGAPTIPWHLPPRARPGPSARSILPPFRPLRLGTPQTP